MKEQDDDFSSTMRIEIPPDVLQAPQLTSPKPESKKVSTRRLVIKIPKPDLRKDGESKYGQLLQSIYDAALITDLKGHVVDSNYRAAEFFLYNHEEFMQLGVLDVISGADESLFDMLRENLENERFALLQAYCVRKDSTYFPAEIAVNLLRFEEPRLCFFVRDVTLRKQAEEELKTEHNALQNASNGIAIANSEGLIQYANPSLLELWGYDAQEELLGRPVQELWRESTDGAAFLRSVLVEHQNWSGELVAARKDGSEFSVQIAGACNRDMDGEPVGMVLSFSDNSDRKRAEDAMRQSERHRAMLASLGAACHHLGQPATVILANLGLIKKLAPEGTNMLKEVLSNTTEAAEALAQILYKLNTIEDFETMKYLDRPDDDKFGSNTILKI
jgi:PAS domain S-box-containing protein